MKKIALGLILLALFRPTPARADFWGADIPLLIQIITNTLQQIAHLKEIIDKGREQISLIQDINRGINDSLALMRTVFPNIDPGTYKHWENPGQAATLLTNLYGSVVNSQESGVQRDADQSVAEAISLNNSVYKHTRDVDEIGEAIKSYSHSASPGGAQKLTAQSLGVMLTVLNQGLRMQATGLKLQAQTLAIQNKREKDSTRYVLSSAEDLSASMKAQNTTYALPRF